MVKQNFPKFFVSTAIPYTNSDPHIGFAMELIIADVLVRFLRNSGKEVFFSTGVDQHGQKNKISAIEKGVLVTEFVEEKANKFLELAEKLNISFTKFVRTTDPAHKLASKELWKGNFDNGLIYKGRYSGLYCVGCEEYKSEKDLVDGKCPDHQKEPIFLDSENYFFKLSSFSEKITNLIDTEKILVLPRSRKNEMLNFCKDGLEDFSISRSIDQLDWGIEVPNDESQVMYVWFDALTNYISACGFPNDLESFQKWWLDEKTYKIHIIGKGIHRFHLAYWPGMLIGAGFPTQNETFIHGFVTSGGMKMSKSIGNVVDPFSLIEKFGEDPVRWFFSSQGSLYEDIDFTYDRFFSVYESDLRKGLGNILNRLISIAKKCDFSTDFTYENLDQKTREVIYDSDLLEKIAENYFLNYDYKGVTDLSKKIVQKINQYFDIEKLWEKPSKEISGVVKAFGRALARIFYFLNPIIPKSSIKALFKLYKFGFLDEGEEALIKGFNLENMIYDNLLFPKID